MTMLSKQYNPHDHEPRIYQKWEKSGVFSPTAGTKTQKKAPYTIMIPLPNVTGSLHMGHALNNTMQDILVRYHRMKGDRALWVPGTDHAGIATQNIVEKQLRKEGKSRHDLGRQKFLERVWEWKEKYGNEIVNQQKRLGLSCDWSRFTFTMDPPYVRAVQETFVHYHQKGYIYRGNRLVNWCPRCASVISDLEVAHKEHDTTLVVLCYPLADASDSIEVATTRPETMLGDTAVAVHPADKRYRQVIGKKIILPLVGREIPIVADARVDQSFGTGAIKVTPAHDPLDADIALTHKLPAINVINEEGRMTKDAGEFAGLAVDEARRLIVERLKQEGAVVSESDYRHSIALCHRCGTVIQPLMSRQWFVDMSKLKGKTIEVAEKDEVTFHPPRWKKHFLEWMNNVHDWTISRQLWWGQPIPVWWKPGKRGTENEEGNYVVSIEKPESGSPANSSATRLSSSKSEASAKVEASGEGPASAQGSGEAQWEQDPDVLDTWFSSALWPLVTLGWPENTRDLKMFYPTSTLVTARDILYLWVARMIFTGLELMPGKRYGNRSQAERIPFRDVLIHPVVLNIKGQRMSKSLGTGVDPMELINAYGADATRFGLIYQISYENQAIKFDEAAIKSARNFANKIWNLARLLDSLPARDDPTFADIWIEQRSQTLAQQIATLIEEYKLGEASRLLHEFVWGDFADWYVEILKIKGSISAANQVFERTLALLHPFMPHITEQLWQGRERDDMLIVSPWPSGSEAKIKAATPAEAAMQRFKDIVTTVRSARTLFEINPSTLVDVYVAGEVPLPEALEKLCRAKVVTKTTKSMQHSPAMPLQTGGTVTVGAPEITADSVRRANQKFSAELHKLEQLVETQEKTLESMRGKASEEAVKHKEIFVHQTRERMEKMRQSMKMFGLRST